MIYNDGRDDGSSVEERYLIFAKTVGAERTYEIFDRMTATAIECTDRELAHDMANALNAK